MIGICFILSLADYWIDVLKVTDLWEYSLKPFVQCSMIRIIYSTFKVFVASYMCLHLFGLVLGYLHSVFMNLGCFWSEVYMIISFLQYIVGYAKCANFLYAQNIEYNSKFAVYTGEHYSESQ